MLVVVDPEVAREAERQRGEGQAPGQGEQVVEDGDPGGDQEADDGHAERAGQPDGPVDHSILLQVPRVAEHPHEQVLGGDVDVQAC